MFITPVIEEPAVQESTLTPVVILDLHTCSGVADVLAHPFFLTHPRHQLEGFVVVRVALAVPMYSRLYGTCTRSYKLTTKTKRGQREKGDNPSKRGSSL